MDGPGGRFALHVGQRSADIDALTDAHQAKTFTYITAYNPRSIVASAERNEKQQQELERAVAESGRPYFRGEGQGAGDWPPEPSLLVLGVSEAEAAGLARRFGQAAVLFGERGKAVRLSWTDVDMASANPET